MQKENWGKMDRLNGKLWKQKKCPIKIIHIMEKNMRQVSNFKKEALIGPLFIDTPRRICLLLDIIPFISSSVNI